MLYDKIDKKCRYGEYDLTKKAAYTVTDSDSLVEPWYYIYQNRRILLYVDQNGPVKIQYQPPAGILVAKRELGEKQSKLQTWIQSPDVNSGIPFSNFNSPTLELTAKKPEYTVSWNPAYATYTLSYPELTVETTLFVPYDKASVVVRTKITNKLDRDIDITVTPSVYPYVNKPQMVAWDLPEWYLSAKSRSNGPAITLCGKMTDPDMKKENERSVTYNLDFDEQGEFEICMSNYTRSGSFFSPRSVTEDLPLTYKMTEADSAPGFGGYTAVFAAKYKATLGAGESKTYTQALTVQEDTSYNKAENEFELCYFSEEGYAERLRATEAFYEDLFTKRTIKTDNPLYDNFINNFAPLQMYWVGSLDRGWPSAMRGSRDASQDFCGILPLYPEWTRSVILDLFFHQRTDGWMPRQVSIISREAPHDMRNFSDGGAFLLELIHEYLTFTRDYSILDERVMWLNSDEESTVLDHIFRTAEYYTKADNIGEHGLCKVWYGDWWDVMDKIGVDGIGESVTVTAQTVLNLKNLSTMLTHLAKVDSKYEKYLPLADEYLNMREAFISAMRTHAYNKAGFFNGYFNDNRRWLLSDCDPDGRERIYIVSNAWAIISGSADEKMADSALRIIEEKCPTKVGYATASTPFYDPIDKAGRMGRGGSTTVGTYNHAESFLVRAACAAGRPDLAYKVSRRVLPIEQEYAPVEKTFAPPFCIANKYSNVDSSLHRVQLQYLSGTVSYVLRNVYNYFVGITYGYEGLTLSPSVPAEFGAFSVEFSYLGKKFYVSFLPSDGERSITVNGKTNDGITAFIPDGEMIDENIVIVKY